MPSATAREINDFVGSLGKKSLVVIRSVGGTQCDILGRVTLAVIPRNGGMAIKFRWTASYGCRPLDIVPASDDFYIFPCPQNRNSTVVFLRTNGTGYNLCPTRCHAKKNCGKRK